MSRNRASAGHGFGIWSVVKPVVDHPRGVGEVAVAPESSRLPTFDSHES
jgi:hypothetical protein